MSAKPSSWWFCKDYSDRKQSHQNAGGDKVNEFQHAHKIIFFSASAHVCFGQR
jgi:hypothetical protein